MTTTEEVVYVRLTGGPRERGHTQGEALRPLIAIGMQRWKEAIAAATGMDPGSYLERFVAGTDFLSDARTAGGGTRRGGRGESAVP